jgi:cell wall-associated NlpC family hydrolase
VSLTNAQRAAVVAEAISWEGTRWEHAQRVKGGGVDCGMLLLEVYERCGLIPHVVPAPYPHDWHMNQTRSRYLEIVEQFCVPTEQALPGDVAVFKWGHVPSHGAIVIEWPVVVHAYVGQGVIRDDARRNRVLRKNFVGLYTLKGAE